MRDSGAATQQTQLLKGALDLAVVAAIGAHESYGYEVLQRLVAVGLDSVGDASVYGALKRMEAAGVLRSHLAPSAEGPARRYYAVTASGRRWFENAALVWAEFADAIEKLLRDQGHHR